MLTLPIKRKWFDMILAGQKAEEYRDVKPYYTMRFRQFVTLNPDVPDHVVEDFFRNAAREGGVKYKNVVIRNGYSWHSAAMRISGMIMIRQGRPEWGASEGREYYVLTVDESEVLNPGIPATKPEMNY